MKIGGNSLGERMAATGGKSTGFDYMRIILALGVIIWHAFPLSYGPETAHAFMRTPFSPVVSAILPLFFALSGFLVAGSMERNPALSTFVGLRVLRIAPALFVEVVLSALILGPLLTDYAMSAYFTDRQFYTYFLNVAGIIHYRLPGVFAANPYPDAVNGQLWTVPWELRCYIALCGLAVLRIVPRRAVFLAVIVAGSLGLWALGLPQSQGISLLIAFLAAVSLFGFRDIVPWNAWLCLACAAVLTVLLEVPGGDFFAGFPAAYVTVYLGLLNPKKLMILRGADYSYGLYLYGFVIQQAVASILPWSHHWYLNLLLTIPIAAAFAAFSWTFVEKPALRLKKFLPRIEQWFANLSFNRPKPIPATPPQN